MFRMVGSGNGASKWAEMLFGHVWGGPVVGTTIIPHPTFKFDDQIRAGKGRSCVYSACNVAHYCVVSLYSAIWRYVFVRTALYADPYMLPLQIRNFVEITPLAST